MIKYTLLVPALKTAAETPLLSTCPCSPSTISRVITHIELLALASTVLPDRFLSPTLLYPWSYHLSLKVSHSYLLRKTLLNL